LNTELRIVKFEIGHVNPLYLPKYENPDFKIMKHWILLSLALYFSTTTAQVCFPYAHENVDRINEHLEMLSSEAMEGRAPGTHGDYLARQYIEQFFEMVVLEPMGEDGGFQQPFVVYNPVLYDKSSVQTKKHEPKVSEDFYPVRYSANGRATGKTKYVKYAMTAPEKKLRNLKRIKSLEGRIAVINISSPDGVHPHSAYLAYSSLQQRIDTVTKLGAAGIILINPDGNASDPSPEFRRLAQEATIPVVFINNPAMAKYFKRSRKDVTVNAKIEEQPVVTANVVGFLNKHRANTIVIGAHHDHLGWGNSASRHRGEPAIHYGADDNASGVSALLELAAYFSQDTLLHDHNIAFIAFGAEEMGLLGSKHWVKNPNVEIEMINYMINMDMIGRMDPEFNVVINGVGTSDTWSKFLEGKFCYQIHPTLKPSGVGPSDHTSFYNVGIPVLHFYTGAHDDYHKPSDTPDKINVEGIELIKRYIQSLVISTDELPKLNYQQTDAEDQVRGRSAAFSVTMGVIPDYVNAVKGMLLDGVTTGKPADKAGLKAGDVIIRLDDHEINDIQSYMQALGTFRKGQKVKATYLRAGRERTTEIVF